MTSPGDLLALSAAQRLNFGWLEALHLKRVMEALEKAAPSGSRFVGGCVRDSLLGDAPKDFDIASILQPDAVVRAVEAAGLKSVPTGIDHGTITVIANHQGVEVTTLRADVSTDGRRATVAFTGDWAADANRRDFTINAIYLTAEGNLYDPLNGLQDVAQRRVRFIGDASQRIREDYLRILRFFRFTARFSESFDAEGLAACAALKDGVGQLSAERIGAEFVAILKLPQAAFALTAMQEAGVLEKVWRAAPDIETVARLKKVVPHASASLTLAALFGEGGDGIGRALRLSNAENAVRANALEASPQMKTGADDHTVRVLTYRLGRDVFVDACALAMATGRIDLEEYHRIISVFEAWRTPPAPFSGQDVLERGVEAGPAVAKVLKAAEDRWIEEDFPSPDRAQAILDRAVADLRV